MVRLGPTRRAVTPWAIPRREAAEGEGWAPLRTPTMSLCYQSVKRRWLFAVLDEETTPLVV